MNKYRNINKKTSGTINANIIDTRDSYIVDSMSNRSGKDTRREGRKLLMPYLFATLAFLVISAVTLYLFTVKTTIDCRQSIQTDSDNRNKTGIICSVIRQGLFKPDETIIPPLPVQGVRLNRYEYQMDNDACMIALLTANGSVKELPFSPSSSECKLSDEVAALDDFIKSEL